MLDIANLLNKEVCKFENNVIHYKKIYFVDLNTQNLQKIQANISKLNQRRDSIMIRHFKPESLPIVNEILRQNKGIQVISHFKNNIKCNIIHTASSAIKRGFAKYSLSFHGMQDIARLKKFQYEMVFLSPVFETQTHQSVKPLGLLHTFKMGFIIKKQAPNCKIYLLGGINERRFLHIKKLDFTDIFSGYGFIRG